MFTLSCTNSPLLLLLWGAKLLVQRAKARARGHPERVLSPSHSHQRQPSCALHNHTSRLPHPTSDRESHPAVSHLPSTTGEMRPITTLVQEVRSQPPRMPGLSEALPLEPWTRQSRKDDGQELSGGAKYEGVDKPISASPGRSSRKST